MTRFARDLAELFDHVGWQNAVVAGCSMGGCVAQALAGLYPSRVSALGLIDTTAWYGEDAPAQWRERAAAVRCERPGRTDRLSNYRAGSAIDFAKRIRSW